VNEKFIEPSLTGISYSFTDDGHYEESYYRAISNPTIPQCPEGIMQFQHGSYLKYPNGSLILTPISVDGRQMQSNPCSYKNSIYTKYNQTEMFKWYEVYTDPYHNIMRLNLYQFDGSPMNPMFLAYKPPQMLPTQTLNPTPTGTAAGATSTANSRVKRDITGQQIIEPLNKNVKFFKNEPINADRWWWIGVGMTAVGGVAYLYS